MLVLCSFTVSTEKEKERNNETKFYVGIFKSFSHSITVYFKITYQASTKSTHIRICLQSKLIQ